LFSVEKSFFDVDHFVLSYQPFIDSTLKAILVVTLLTNRMSIPTHSLQHGLIKQVKIHGLQEQVLM